MTRHAHFVYGERIDSSIPLPELRGAPPGPARWTFDVVDALPTPISLEPLGEEPIYGAVSARLYRHAQGHRIDVDDTGVFDLSDDGRSILWQPTEDPWWDFGRGHLIGRVLATALHLDGVLTLHASAVEVSDGVLGFLAPKHFGKSTLGLSLYQAGARFVTDDSLPVLPGPPALAMPGIHSLRVRAGDADAERLLGRPIIEEPGRDGKVFLPPLPVERVLNQPAPLAALYLVIPTAPDAQTDAAVRSAVDSVPASIFLVGQSKISAMLGPSFVSGLLDATSKIVGSVPVYQLRIVRDLELLPRVVEQIFNWHGDPAPASTTENGIRHP